MQYIMASLLSGTFTNWKNIKNNKVTFSDLENAKSRLQKHQ